MSAVTSVFLLSWVSLAPALALRFCNCWACSCWVLCSSLRSPRSLGLGCSFRYLRAQLSCVLTCQVNGSPCVWEPQKNQIGCWQLKGAGGSIWPAFSSFSPFWGVQAASPLAEKVLDRQPCCPETRSISPASSAAFYWSAQGHCHSWLVNSLSRLHSTGFHLRQLYPESVGLPYS